MKIPKILKVEAATLVMIAGTGGAWSTFAGGADTPVAGITDFQSERIKCYCTEDGKDGLRLQGKNLYKHFKRSDDGTVKIYDCGTSNRVLIYLAAESVIVGDSTCYASAEHVSGEFHNCWIKESYIEQKGDCEAADAGDLEFADQKAKCEQLGAVLGAGACKKEDKD